MIFRSVVFASLIAIVTSQECLICGEGGAVTIGDAIFDFPGQPVVDCSTLDFAGKSGLIPLDACPQLFPLIATLCGCEGGTPPPPVDPVVDGAPSDSPITTAPIAGTGDTSAGPVAPPVGLPTDVPVALPGTSAPAIIMPKTDPPVTDVPDTGAPVTDAPGTDAPVTEAPIVVVAPTAPIVSVAPATMTPIMTGVPATMAPVTMAPVTMAPVTMAPVTMAPVTMAPATMAPDTMAPVVAPTDAPVPPPTDAPVPPPTAMPSGAATTGTLVVTCLAATVAGYFM